MSLMIVIDRGVPITPVHVGTGCGRGLIASSRTMHMRQGSPEQGLQYQQHEQRQSRHEAGAILKEDVNPTYNRSRLPDRAPLHCCQR